jgi:hypothetical protein
MQNRLYNVIFNMAHFLGYMSKAWKMGFGQGKEYMGDRS